MENNKHTPNVSEELENQLGRQQQDPDAQRNANEQGQQGASYEDIAGNKQEYQPNSQGLTNTGSGAEAAVGTEYSWNKKANESATNSYEQEVNKAKQNLLNNRQTLENNSLSYQEQTDMMKYKNNQNAEKVGWTGGYVLDQNRQMEYLKASIQSQMYGAMELQKYGYDSALAAARLSYDLNQQEYARQYYQEAVTQALSEAQLTGTYFSAETKDMMRQLAVAQQKLDDPNTSDDERKQAETIKTNIYNWFSSNGISTEGVKTLEAWQAEQANELQWSNELWNRYDAALRAAKTSIADNVDEFIMLDQNGKEMWDGVNVTTSNWNTISGSDIVKYLEEDASGQRKQQFYSYIEDQLANKSSVAFASWLQKNGYETKDEQGNATNTSGETYGDLYGRYLAESNVFTDFITKKFKDTTDEEKEKLANALNGFDITVNLPDGSTKTFTLQLVDSDGNVIGSTDTTERGENQGNNITSKGYISDNTSSQSLINGLTADYSNKTDDQLTETEKVYKQIQELLDDVLSQDLSTGGGWQKVGENVQNILFAGSWRDTMSFFGNIWKEGGLDWSSNAKKAKLLQGTLDSLYTIIGKTNIKKILTTAKEYNKLSDRDKLSLSDSKRQLYENAVALMNKIDKLKAAKDFYSRNDSATFTWEYVADTWANVGHNWSHMNNIGDFFGALGGTLNAVGTSIVSGITGLWHKILTWSW